MWILRNSSKCIEQWSKTSLICYFYGNKFKRLLMKFLIAILVLASLSSCFSSSIMQTAKPVEKNKVETTLGISGYTTGEGGLPSLDAMVRYGVSKKSDLGLAYSLGLFGHFKLDYKHVLYASPNQNAFLSTGFGVDGILYEGTWSEPKDVGLTVPLYFSFNHTKKVIPYFAQKVTFSLRDAQVLGQYKNDPGFTDYNLDHNWYYAGGGGVKWGQNRLKWFAELSYSVRFNREYTNSVFVDEFGVTDRYFRKSTDPFGMVQLTLGMVITQKVR